MEKKSLKDEFLVEDKKKSPAHMLLKTVWHS